MFDKAMNFVFLFLDRSSEYSAFWRCVKAGAAYLVTQLCKVKERPDYFTLHFKVARPSITVKINLFKYKRFKDGRCRYKNTGSSHLNLAL